MMLVANFVLHIDSDETCRVFDVHLDFASKSLFSSCACVNLEELKQRETKNVDFRLYSIAVWTLGSMKTWRKV